MLICIPNVLKRDEVQHILGVLATGQFVDGKLSVADTARDVKRNLEYKRPGEETTEIDQIVGRGLLTNQIFQDFVLPKQIAPPIFSRYDPGMEYGLHVDNPIMGQRAIIRSDMSTTIFLSDPTSYDGGELTVQTTYGEQAVKLPPGDAVVYPSTSLHRVQEVTRGSRLVALTWSQSLVKDEGMREILFDLSAASRDLAARPAAGEDMTEIKDRLFKVYANLMRRQADV